jgi:hypothetical protein
MRKLIARVYDYSLDGLIATEGTEFFQFCRDLPDDPAEDASGSAFYAGGTCTSWAGLLTRAWPATSRPPPVIPTPAAQRRTQGGLLPHAQNRRLCQHHHRQRRPRRGGRHAAPRRRRLHRRQRRHHLVALARAARPDRRVPGDPGALTCGRGRPLVRGHRQVPAARPGVQHRLQQRTPAHLPTEPLTEG